MDHNLLVHSEVEHFSHVGPIVQLVLEAEEGVGGWEAGTEKDVATAHVLDAGGGGAGLG